MNRDLRSPLPIEPWLTDDDVPAAVRPLVRAAREGGDPKEALSESVRALGFDWFGFALFRREGPDAEVGYGLWTTFPDGWNRAYLERNFQAIDPRYRAAMRSAIPEVWDRTSYGDEPAVREFFDTAATFGIRSGVWIVINQPNPSYVEIFSVGSTKETIDAVRRQAIARTMGDLWALGAYGHRLLVGAILNDGNGKANRRRLSGREVECLTLAARGSTSRAIAGRLGISERTVNAHIERAIRKCGARNRQEAIARGISGGLISF